jgi:hypothetical protein
VTNTVCIYTYIYNISYTYVEHRCSIDPAGPAGPHQPTSLTRTSWPLYKPPHPHPRVSTILFYRHHRRNYSLSLSLIARMPPSNCSSEHVNAGPPGAAPPYSTLLVWRSSLLLPIRFTPPSPSLSMPDLAGSRVTEFPPRHWSDLHHPSCVDVESHRLSHPRTSSSTLI